MADVSKLRKKGLGAPPPMEEATPNLKAPEHAPVAHHDPAPRRVDGRTTRRSNRTQQFATRVTPEFDERIRAIAARDGLLLVEVLEQALDAYESGR
jgi:hypothetical protein